MTSPRLVVRWFGKGQKEQWPRMVRVLTHTAVQHLAGWDLDIASFAPDQALSSPLGVQGNVDNTVKLDEWCKAVWCAQEGDRLLLLDADTVILRPLDDIWDRQFDVAYTVKPKGARFPLNAGVVFVRVSARSRAFMRSWQTQNRIFLEDAKEFQVWRHMYGGLNQTALAVLLRSDDSAGLLKLPCAEWNVEDEHWATFDPAVARILHCKSELARGILARSAIDPKLRPLVRRWRELEAETMRPQHQEVTV